MLINIIHFNVLSNEIQSIFLFFLIANKNPFVKFCPKMLLNFLIALFMFLSFLNNIFFSKYLLTNYFTDANDISVKDSVLKRIIIMYRNVIFDWIYKGIDNNFELAERRFSLDLIKNALINNYTLRAMTQLNLHWSLEDYLKREPTESEQ